MDVPRPASAARRSTASIPPKSDASLAEWTSKIKALQRQVDDDEEAETRRLEAEIAASRQARMRRSANYGSRANSVDLSQTGLASSPMTEDSSVLSDEPLNPKDKRRNQDDALRKLMGEDTSVRSTSRSPASTAPAPSKRSSSPISLAAFIGGRATGPRLTKHAPQQDAHDPTQFDQRTHITAPHPVFGRGGVAMPGMTGNGKASAVSRAIREEEAKPSVSSSPLQQRDRHISTPAAASPVPRVVEKPQEREREREIVPNYTGRSPSTSRQRTISTPTGVVHSKLSTSVETFTTTSKPEPIARPLSHSPNLVIRPITPRTSMGSLVQSGTKSPAPRPLSAASHTPPPSSPTHSPKPSTPSSGLARSVQPSPRPSFGSPQLPPSVNTSLAFTKSPPAKEPTPSLSRLQGRGFVKNMVEKSASLDVVLPDGSPTLDRAQGRRQSTVLDRWQHTTAGFPSPPVISPKPMPLRKSFTADPTSTSPTTSSYSIPLKRESTAPVLISKTSLPTLRTMATGGSVGASSAVSEGAYMGLQLGSAKTVITFIQPTRTGDQPLSPPQQEADELGIRVRTRTISGGLVQERGEAGLPTGQSAGKPLSHPTKERAKKPRKGKSATIARGASNLAVIREASPTREASVPISLSLHVAPTHRAPSLTPPQTFTPMRTTSPISQYPSPPATKGRVVSPGPLSDMDTTTKPISLAVNLPAAVTSPTSPLASPPVARSPSVTPPKGASEKAPPSPRHSRIPSTGNRATVMDVAQAFTEALQHEPPSALDTKARSSPGSSPTKAQAGIATKDEDEEYTPLNVRNMIASWGPRSTNANGAYDGNGSSTTTTTITAPPLERRKSNYDKYSAFILPPLKEERTPVPSPAGTLRRDAGRPEAAQEELRAALIVSETKQDAEMQPVVHGQKHEIVPKVAPAPIAAPVFETKPQSRDELIHLAHEDEPLPRVNIDALYLAPRLTYAPDPDVMTISVEVMCIVGSAATPLATNAHVFYDSELLAVVHRAKAKSSGLVSTELWAWRGKRGQVGKQETQKVQELARRYSTTPVHIEQTREPPEFVSILGGKLATRQGTRAHWSAENTAMHVVRSSQGLIFIDELDLGIKRLCSGYSYCISILDTFYVWHGRGSIAAEQCAALEYARALAPSEEHVVELTEDESQADEMFWMILGEGDYAKAGYWRWRADAPFVEPGVWAVDATQSDPVRIVRSVSAFPTHSEFNHEVYLVDCIWELFVLVGSEARGRRLDIRLALNVAEALARKASSTRPFTPTVHALIFPTQIPTDLLLTFRDIDEFGLNSGDIPDHMNLIPAKEADTNLKSTTWTLAELKDHTMLPLGITPWSVS